MISPYLSLPLLLPLLAQSPTSIPYLSALTYLLSQPSPPTCSAPHPTLHEARLRLTRAFLADGRFAEAESEAVLSEREARTHKGPEWRESVILLEEVLEQMGRVGRAKVWKAKLEAFDSEQAEEIS